MQQRTPEWFAAKCGKVSASRIADLMATTKSGWSASRTNYVAELVAERLTGQTQDGYVSPAMTWGTETEADARIAYEFFTGTEVEEVGFINHPTILMAGASPDGHTSDGGSLEIKCPNTATHIETLISESIQGKYLLQMQFQMACNERPWCDFVSYDPRLPEGLKFWVKRVPRDNDRIAAIEAEVTRFLKDVDTKVRQLTELIKGNSPLAAMLQASLEMKKNVIQ